MMSGTAVIGEATIPCTGTLNIEETSDGFFLSGYSRDEYEKQVVLRNLGWIRRGSVEHAKFQTHSGLLIDGAFEIADARFAEEVFPDHRRLVFGISLKRVTD
jgi:hypothetical protein